jgi:hypothetical protein
MAQEAAEIRLRAERKAGQVLILMAVKGERDAGRGGDRKSPTHDEPVILADLGVERNQATRWQEIARVPEELTIQSRNALARRAAVARPHPMPA